MSLPVADLAAARDLVVLLDYDGTLVGLRRRPELALLSDARRRRLALLARGAHVAVVSGRSLRDVQRLVGIASLDYIGNHGLEIACGGRLWVHPAAAKARPDLVAVLRRVRARTSAWKGVLVEDKGATAAIHYRLLAREDVPALKAIVREEVGRRGGTLRTTHGKEVIEIRPKVAWDKGHGVIELLRRFGPVRDRAILYIGDDRTDEDAFRALRGKGLTVRVGAAAATSAEIRVPGVGAVWTLLNDLAEARRPVRPFRGGRRAPLGPRGSRRR